MKKGILKKARYFLFLVLPFLGIGVGTAFSQTPEYATFSGGLSGTGNFTCRDLPDFTYTVTGQTAPGDTAIPGESQIVENNGGGMELIYGQADAEQNIQVEVEGYGAGDGDGEGDPITNIVTTTLVFDEATIPGSLAFLVADIEQDQVTICAQDANGVDVPISVINGWFQQSFDADNSDTNTSPPSWDAASATLVGQYASAPVKQSVYDEELLDNEAGAAWFQVDIPITQLQLKFTAMGVNPDDPSYHLFVAAICPDCPDPNCADIIIKN